MARPVLLAVDDDPNVLSAVERDLRRHYGLDYYLQKPWDPPDQQLYPVLDDLLDDWKASYRPPFEGIRAIGTRWAPQSYALRSFLGHHQIPYQWLDVESNPDACALLPTNGSGPPRL